MNTTTFYIARRDTAWRYYAASGRMARELKDAQRYSCPFDPALLKRVAEERRVGGTAKIVRVTEVPGAEKREVIPEGQAYDPKDVQYAIQATGSIYCYTGDKAGVWVELNEAPLFKTSVDAAIALQARYRDGKVSGGPGFVCYVRIVPVRVVKSDPTFTEEVVQ